MSIEAMSKAYEALNKSRPFDADNARMQRDAMDALRTAIQQAEATQAEVTDEQINAAYLAWCKTNGTPESFARAIRALRPVQVPMTREQAMAIVQSNPDTMTAIRMTEAHHCITAQAKKETP